MTEVIEQEARQCPPLEGDVVLAGNGEKLFKNINAVADYVSIFGIKDYNIRDGHTSDGKYVVQLQYTKQNI